MDGQAQVRLVFAGDVLEGHTLDQVKRRFGEAFKLEGDRLAAVFAGGRTVIKRSIGRDDGERYVAKLRKLGMQVLIEPINSAPELKEPQELKLVPAAVAPAAASDAVKPVPMAIPPLAPLEEEVTCPNCSNRQPKKFVLCRECNTDIPRALEAKREDADRARAERLAARQEGRSGGRYAPPTADVDGGYVSDVVDAPPMVSFSFEGRFGRVSYFNAYALAMVSMAVTGILAAVLVPITRSALILIPIVPLFLAFLVWNFRVCALRLHDINRSGWWGLLSFVPYVNFVFGVVLAFWPGNADDNDYGSKPKRGNLAIAIAVLVISIVSVIVIAAVALPAYKRYGDRAREMQQQRVEAQERAQEQQATQGLPAGPAVQVFRDQYLPASNEKAFAVSGAGAYGFASGKISAREAISAALADCEQRREAYTSQCRIVNVNGLSPRDQE
ncbi:MAG: DUF805 domain-containing protein [Rhizobacter sp.]